MAHVQLQISTEALGREGLCWMGRLRGTFGTGEIRSSLAPGTAITGSHSGYYQAAHCFQCLQSRYHSPGDGLELRHRRQAFVAAGLFVVVFVFLVAVPPINMLVQGGILG